MKRWIIFLLAALLLCGCGAEETYTVARVIEIPMNPTEKAPPAITEEPVTEPLEEAPTEAAEPQITEAIPTETTEKKSTSTKTTSTKGTSSKKPASNKTSSTTSKPKETKPAETKPAATVPAAQTPTAAPTERPTEAPTEPPFDPASYVCGDLEYAFLEELNARRSADGVAALELSGKLSGIAAIRAREISQVWSAARPDGRSYSSVMDDHGYGFTAAAQLLIHTAGSGDAPALVDRWMGYETNRASILSGDFTTAGIGVYHIDGMIYIACILTN